MRRLFVYLPVLAWMTLIFLGSTDVGSPKHTSRFLVPFLRWLVPNISEEALSTAQLAVRKSAHISEYGILALLCWSGRRLDTRRLRYWSWKEFWSIIAVCSLYAVSDELHQLFVASRGSSPVDVAIDAVGASLFLLLVYWLGGTFKLWPTRPHSTGNPAAL
jgi:VanZ family protein